MRIDCGRKRIEARDYLGAIVVIQVRYDVGLNQGGTCGDVRGGGVWVYFKVRGNGIV